MKFLMKIKIKVGFSRKKSWNICILKIYADYKRKVDSNKKRAIINYVML